MQERISECLVNNKIVESEIALVDDVSVLSGVDDVADMVNGYAECMAEAVRYLLEVEKYPRHHPAVRALECHLDKYKTRLFRSALRRFGRSSQ